MAKFSDAPRTAYKRSVKKMQKMRGSSIPKRPEYLDNDDFRKIDDWWGKNEIVLSPDRKSLLRVTEKHPDKMLLKEVLQIGQCPDDENDDAGFGFKILPNPIRLTHVEFEELNFKELGIGTARTLGLQGMYNDRQRMIIDVSEPTDKILNYDEYLEQQKQHKISIHCKKG